MDISERTVKREWQKARAFLFDALRRDGRSLASLHIRLCPRDEPSPAAAPFRPVFV